MRLDHVHMGFRIPMHSPSNMKAKIVAHRISPSYLKAKLCKDLRVNGSSLETVELIKGSDIGGIRKMWGRFAYRICRRNLDGAEGKLQFAGT